MSNLSVVSRAIAASLALTVAAYAQCPPPEGYPSGGGSPIGAPSPSAGAPSNPNPSSPSTPSPAGPSTPKPAGPGQTGGPSRPNTPRGPSAGRAGAPTTGPRGMPISFERGATSKSRLKLDWVHPVPPERSGQATAAAGPLPLGDALDLLWAEDDGRPLLVLRECRLCQGSDGALLSRSLANDKTMLLTKWFRTVKLPAHVAENGHAFHNVFKGYEFEDGWPHFFLLAHKDAKPVEFSGTQTQSQLWKAMTDVLEDRYAKDPKRALKKWLSLLDSYDALDSRRRDLNEQLLEVRATKGPDSSRAKKLAKKLAELDEERADLEKAEKDVMDLGLLPAPEKVASK